MKKISFYSIMFLISSILMTYSCEKTDDTDDGGGDDNPSVKKVLVKREDMQAIDASSETYAFNADKNIEKQIYLGNTNDFKKANVFKYDVSKKIISYTTFLDEALTNIESVSNLTYNTNSQPTKMVTDATGEITTATYTYQSGKLFTISIAYSGSSSLPPQEYEYEWSGDNISKIITKVPDTTGAGGFMVAMYTVFSYDTKINPYYNMKLPNFEPTYVSKNNVTKAEAFDANNIKLALITIDYKYDGDYPSTADYDVGFKQGKYNYTYSEL